jgi:LCP family protein required for cell wall assembly
MPRPFGRHRLLDPRGEQASYEHSQRRARIIGRIVVGFLAAVVLVASIGVLTVKNILDKVHHTASLDHYIAPSERPAKETPDAANGKKGTPQNILILGVDSRLGENSEFQVTPGSGLPQQTETLSDTAILAHLSGDGKNVTLVSIPRDSVVKIPACDKVDAEGNIQLDSSGQPLMTSPTTALFNEAIQRGGPACTVKTLEQLTGVYIDHFVEIDFQGVIKMSNALGGVPMNICDPIHDSHTGLNLPAGEVNLKGQQALAFVRARYGLTGGDDLHRIQRQQQFMASMARKALTSSTFFNLPSMTGFYGDVASSLTTDMGGSTLINLALRYRHLDTTNIVFATVPTYPAPKGDKWYQHLYWSDDEAKALFTAIRDDRPLTATASNGQNVASLTVAPSNVTVKVLNATTTNGLAGQTADALASRGFRIAGIGTASQQSAKTTLTYAASRTNSAETLAAALTGTPEKVVSATAGTVVTLTIGSDWSGLASETPPSSAPSTTPTPGASAAGSPAPSGSPIPGVKTTNASTQSCVQG